MLGTALLFCLCGSVFSLQLTPPLDVDWVREQQSDVTLVCQASTKIHSCSWTTPYGEQYPLESNLKAEGGRLEHFANDKDVDCGIKINSIEARDNGMWQCNVGVVENNEVRVENGSATINIADPEPPTKLSLETPFNETTSNFTQGVVNKVSCTAFQSRPAPTFSWTVEDETISDYTENVFDEEELVFTQVLHFTPTADHANKTLTCSVVHPGLAESMISTTDIRLSPSSLLTARLGPGYISLIVIVAAAGLIITGAVLVAARMKMNRNNPLTPTDEEKGAEDSAVPENEEKEKTEEVEEKKGMNLQEKFVKILIALKPKEKKAADDVPATEFEKIDLNEKEESKVEETEEEEQPATEKKGFGERINIFLSKLRPSPAEKKVETEETETKQEEVEEPKEDVELDQEPKDESITQKRRGSETSV